VGEKTDRVTVLAFGRERRPTAPELKGFGKF
jgi:hypothetical protein